MIPNIDGRGTKAVPNTVQFLFCSFISRCSYLEYPVLGESVPDPDLVRYSVVCRSGFQNSVPERKNDPKKKKKSIIGRTCTLSLDLGNPTPRPMKKYLIFAKKYLVFFQLFNSNFSYQKLRTDPEQDLDASVCMDPNPIQ